MAGMALPTPTLHTARLRLRPFTDADADALFALHSSAYVLRYWDAPPWSERARAERFIATCRQMADEGSGARLAMDRASDGAFIGWCSLTRWNPDYRSASMGYCLDDAAWGHGYATEAARALLQWAFDTLDLNRVQAETDTRNAASARVLEKLGFVREGTLREDCVVNGDVSDSWVFGLIRREWRPCRGRPHVGRTSALVVLVLVRPVLRERVSPVLADVVHPPAGGDRAAAGWWQAHTGGVRLRRRRRVVLRPVERGVGTLVVAHGLLLAARFLRVVVVVTLPPRRRHVEPAGRASPPAVRGRRVPTTRNDP